MLPSHTYHIYNHANGGDNVFREPKNIEYFKKRWRRYIDPIATTYAFCYMPNHFHMMLRVKDRRAVIDRMIKLKKLNLAKIPILPDYDQPETFNKLITMLEREAFSVIDIEQLDQMISRFVVQQFSNLFNGYTQAINKIYRRYGSLFAPRFRRIPVMDEDYGRKLILYIHRNPVHHRFRKRMEQWSYSSYNTYMKSIESWDKSPISEYFLTYQDFVEFHEHGDPDIG